MIVFIENLAGIQITSHSNEFSQRWCIKVVRDSVMPWTTDVLRSNGPVIVLRPGLLRWLKLLLSVLQLPVVQQDPTSLAFRCNLWRRVLSDGLLTEYLVHVLKLPIQTMYSVTSVVDGNVSVVPGCAVIGSNWMEFGMMTETTYVEHLCFLNHTFPDSKYYCHPKETNPHPEFIFGSERVVRPNEPIEAWLRKRGMPKRLTGVCSSSLLSMAVGNQEPVTVDLVKVPRCMFDGPAGDIVETLKRPINNVKSITVRDLQHFLIEKLMAAGVPLNVIEQTLRDTHSS